MQGTGEFKEPLPCGGVLRVGPKSWDIGYSFSGPDRRYKTSYISIPGNEVVSCVEALRDNWNELERLKAKLPPNIEYEIVGKRGMTIHLGKTMDGIYLQARFKTISTRGQLENIIRSYKYAVRKAAEMQALFSRL